MNFGWVWYRSTKHIHKRPALLVKLTTGRCGILLDILKNKVLTIVNI